VSSSSSCIYGATRWAHSHCTGIGLAESRRNGGRAISAIVSGCEGEACRYTADTRCGRAGLIAIRPWGLTRARRVHAGGPDPTAMPSLIYMVMSIAVVRPISFAHRNIITSCCNIIDSIVESRPRYCIVLPQQRSRASIASETFCLHEQRFLSVDGVRGELLEPVQYWFFISSRTLGF